MNNWFTTFIVIVLPTKHSSHVKSNSVLLFFKQGQRKCFIPSIKMSCKGIPGQRQICIYSYIAKYRCIFIRKHYFWKGNYHLLKIFFIYKIYYIQNVLYIKGSVHKKWKGWSLLILLLSSEKIVKTTRTEERSFNTNSESCNIRLGL